MRIQIHPAFVLYFLCIGMLSSRDTCISTLLALLFHELGHCVACFAIHEKISKITLTPFGGTIQYAQGTIPRKGLKGFCVALAGPLINYIMLLSLALKPVQSFLGQSAARLFAAANLSMLLLNLLPIFPLDGGRMLFCIGYYLFPVTNLIAFLSNLGICVGLIFIALAIYGIRVYSVLNFSLVFIGFYIFICARQSARAALAESTYAIIQERMQKQQGIRPVRLYRVSKDTVLSDLLIDVVSRANRFDAEFLFENEHFEECRISDQMLCRLFLETPLATISQAHPTYSIKREKRS